MNAYDLALAAAAEPASLDYIPHPRFRQLVLQQADGRQQIIKAKLVEREGDTVTVWLWTAQPSMSYLSDQEIIQAARSQVADGEHVHRIRANAHRGASQVGGEVLEYIYRVGPE